MISTCTSALAAVQHPSLCWALTCCVLGEILQVVSDTHRGGWFLAFGVVWIEQIGCGHIQTLILYLLNFDPNYKPSSTTPAHTYPCSCSPLDSWPWPLLIALQIPALCRPLASVLLLSLFIHVFIVYFSLITPFARDIPTSWSSSVETHQKQYPWSYHISLFSIWPSQVPFLTLFSKFFAFLLLYFPSVYFSFSILWADSYILSARSPTVASRSPFLTLFPIPTIYLGGK